MTLPTHFPMKAPGGKTIQVPVVGFGTWAAGGTGWCKDAVLAALKAGYRHLDCAWYYGVDEEIGAAIRESGIPRSEIFVVTKIWPHFFAPENVELCLNKCLDKMGLEYVDLVLAHWPCAFEPISREVLEKAQSSPTATNEGRGIMVDSATGSPVIDWEHCTAKIASKAGHKGSFVPTWLAMKELVASGKTRAIGLSNFSRTEIKEILPYADDVPVSCNQIEVHPWLPNTELIDFHKEHDILTTCYSPFAGQKEDGKTLIKDATVKRIAEKNGMDVGQCLQSWAVKRGTSPLGKSQSEARIKSNLAVKELPEEDMKALDALEIPDGKGRTNDFTDRWGVSLYTD